MMRSQFATGSEPNRKRLTMHRPPRELPEKMRSEPRQRFGRKMRRDRVILHGRTEFVAYLLVDSINDLLTRKHGRPYRGLHGFKRIDRARQAVARAKAGR